MTLKPSKIEPLNPGSLNVCFCFFFFFPKNSCLTSLKLCRCFHILSLLSYCFFGHDLPHSFKAGESNCWNAFSLFGAYLPFGFPKWLSSEESTCRARDLDLIPGLGRFPGEGNSNPHQYSCLGNPMDRGVWRTIVCGVAEELAMT